MFTEVFGDSPRVKLLDFLADHLDFDYTMSQMRQFTGISRPTLYKLVESLEKERLVVFTREVGGSRFFKINVGDPRVVSILRMDFGGINEDLLAGRFEVDDPESGGGRLPVSKRMRRKARSASAGGVK